MSVFTYLYLFLKGNRRKTNGPYNIKNLTDKYEEWTRNIRIDFRKGNLLILFTINLTNIASENGYLIRLRP